MRTIVIVGLSALIGIVGCTPIGNPPAQDGGPDGDARGPDAHGPDAHVPDADVPDSYIPDAFVPDAFVPDALVPDAFVPDAFVPDAFVPDAIVIPSPPIVVSTVPLDGASDVDTGLAIEVGFDEPIAVSGQEDGLQLLDHAGELVSGTVEVQGDTLRFVPADGITLLGDYTAVVTTAVTDLAGTPLAEEHRFWFRVRDGVWEPTGTLIETREGRPQTPDVAMDPRGNVAVVWSQGPSPSSVWANHYDADTGAWQTAQRLELDDAGNAVAPRIAMDDAGNALAVWQQSDGATNHVWASRYDGAGWDAPVQLDVTQTGQARSPRIAMNADGAAAVVWQQPEGGTTQAWFNRYVVGVGWAGAEPVLVSGQPVSIIAVEEPVVGIDAQGDALVLLLDATFRLRAVPYLAASGWAQDLNLLLGPSEAMEIAMTPSGTAFGLWQRPQPALIHGWRRGANGATSLSVLMSISEENRGVLRVGDLTANAEENAIALWYQDSPGPLEVWTRTYSAATQTWSSAQRLVPHESSSYRGAQVAMDSRGHAHAIWIADDDSGDVLMITRRQAPGTFGATDVHPGIEAARIAVNAQGKAVLIRAVQAGPGNDVNLDAVLFH